MTWGWGTAQLDAADDVNETARRTERAMSLADAARTVVDLAKPNTPKIDRERTARKLLMRLDGPDERRARLLRDAASNARNDPAALRRYLAAREVLLHPTSEGTTP